MQSRVRWVWLVAALIAAARPAAAEPEWVTDLRAKAEAHEQRLRDALARLDAAAAAAADKLTADMRARLAELLAILTSNLDAARQVLADHAHDYTVIVHARLREAAAVANQLGRQLDEVIAGTRRQIDVDLRRLVVGARGIVDDSLREAQHKLAGIEVVDDAVVVRAVDQAERSLDRWLGILAAAGGLVVVALGAGLVWQRRRPGERAARRWLVTGAGAIVIAGGATACVLGVRHWRAGAAGTAVVAGLTRCDALADAQRLIDAGRAGPAHKSTAAALARCQLLVADTSTAELVADRLAKLRSLPD